LPYGISLLLLDFSGCGISEGEFISLGYFEKEDTKKVMDFIKNLENICISEFGIWGRSMGAATALMLSKLDSTIRFIVADSSFISI
jgi:alpha/beta superfamily hydrolase